MDNATRNEIQRATQNARRLLEDAYRQQLEGTYDILLDGTIAEQPGGHLSERQKVTREKLVAAVAHKRSAGLKAKEAVGTFLCEAAFTTLNRFVALKMLEARDLVQECVSKGEDSSGFKEFAALAAGLVAVEGKGYRLYIETLFDEIGQEVKVLFDRRDVASLLWPDRQTLLELLAILNAPELASVWVEDETIGWVYQYFNGDEERTKMRAESQAPRNSRELAVRNQFFTPRYVVQFLTDNTLGRTWYEMMQGETKLADLDYLVRRPNEVFLAEGKSAPETKEDDSELSQEELLQQTVYVPFRAKKDPRDLRILDPACGSGHFLLYAFELLVSIYEEAWSDAGAAAFTETGAQLREDYGDIDDLLHAMPDLILRHNLHGVDIDPRAAQIAALALWMRGQRAYNQFEVGRAERPPITKTNIVVAEPMPGDAELVDEFAGSLKPTVLGELFKSMVEEMKVAGELGSLLKIEASIARVVKDAEEAHRQGNLFADKVEGHDFWDTADEEIIAALETFAESAAGSAGIRRQLFAGDAAQGVAFIELMRKRFDAVLMNPPFGEFLERHFKLLSREYPRSKRDLAIAFVERARGLVGEGARIGCLASRKPFYLGTQAEWRRNLLRERCLEMSADLGHRVLDGAMVEVAATIFAPGAAKALFISCLADADKADALRHKVGLGSSVTQDLFIIDPSEFLTLPSAQFAYATSHHLLRLFREAPALEPGTGVARVGLQTSNNERFIRLWWELHAEASELGWVRMAKGGAYVPFFCDPELCVKWEGGRGEMAAFNLGVGNEAQSRRGSKFYFVPAATYTERTNSRFSARLLPPGMIFNVKGPVLIPHEQALLIPLLGVVNSLTFAALLELCLGSGDSVTSGSVARDYTTGLLSSMPFPAHNELSAVKSEPVSHIVECQIRSRSRDETSGVFAGLTEISKASSLRALAENWLYTHEEDFLEALQYSAQNEENVAAAYNLEGQDNHATVDTLVGRHPCQYPHSTALSERTFIELYALSVDALIDAIAPDLGFPKYVTSQFHVFDRRLELLCHAFGAHPNDVVAARRSNVSVSAGHERKVAVALVSFAVGKAFGRWPDNFPEVPSCKAIEQGDARLCEWRVATQDCPDVLADDTGSELDFATVVEAKLFEIVGPERGVLEDVPRALGSHTTELRDWLRKSFYSAHLTQYSMHRRRAPVYWQLATPSASYSVWCYYHRLTRDTFFRVANDCVTPKVDHEERKLNVLRQEAGPDPSSKQSKAIDAQETFVAELRAFAAEVSRIAPLWNPNLNDGVSINFAPLWRLLPQHKPWQKECKACWDKLCQGDYDWAHLAMHLWPERVVPKCQDDRSLAIAHGLEDEFWYEDDDGKWQKRQGGDDRVAALVAERESTAVKAALKDLLEAPAAAGQSRRKRRAKA